MRGYARSVLLIALALAVVALATCSLQSVSIPDRISMFVSSLNTDRSTTYQNLDPKTAAYSFTATASWWNSPFNTGYEPYSFAPNPPNTTNPSDVQVTITGTGGVGQTNLYQFLMVNVGTGSEDWRIHSINVWTGSWTSIGF